MESVMYIELRSRGYGIDVCVVDTFEAIANKGDKKILYTISI